jgi:hypothetical protein
VLPEFQRSIGESLPSFTKSAVCWQFCWQLQLGSSQLIDAQASELEARVGIGRLMPVFRPKTRMFAEQFQVTPSLFGLTGFNPLTEDFTEGFSLAPASKASHSSALTTLSKEPVGSKKFIGGMADGLPHQSATSTIFIVPP